MTGSVSKGAVGEGFVDPVGKTGGLTAVSFCFVSTVEGGVLTTPVETSGNVAGTTIGNVPCFSDVSGTFEDVVGILVSSDVTGEASETGNSVPYLVVVANVDRLSGSVDVVETTVDGTSVAYIVAGYGVDTSSSL